MRKAIMYSLVALCTMFLVAGGSIYASGGDTWSQIVALTKKANKNPTVLNNVDLIYQFNVDNEKFQVDIKQNKAKSTTGTPWVAECIISMKKENFDKLLNGQLTPFKAYISGKLKILKGSLSDAKDLGDIITQLNKI